MDSDIAIRVLVWEEGDGDSVPLALDDGSTLS